MTSRRVHFVASAGAAGRKALSAMEARYGQCSLDEATMIVALGGDGFMLQTLHQVIDRELPVYGMKIGRVGFLMNRYVEGDLDARLDQARVVALNPLHMRVHTEAGTPVNAMAINEVSLLRQTNQAAHIRILVNDTVRVEELVCDGVLVATAAGSTAYNSSVRGPILPIGTDAMALTPISPFRPRRWSGAILPGNSQVRFEIVNHLKRPVSATADAFEVRNIVSVDVQYDKGSLIHLMFDPDHSLEERILNEQFL
jgi:NAD+ kinase